MPSREATQSRERRHDTRRSRDTRPDGFPDFDTEYKTVRDINERMMAARDEWDPPDSPSYKSDTDPVPAYYTGVVRAIETAPSNRRGERRVRFGLDIGESSLKWVSVTDTGERALTNRFVKLCKAYDVNPESIQEFYTKELTVSRRNDDICIEPYHQPFTFLWHLWMAHGKYKLWMRQDKKHMKGIVPTWRFFPVYLSLFGLLFAGAYAIKHASLGVATIPAAFPIVVSIMFASALFLWGTYTKLRHDVAPFISDWLAYRWDVYVHKHG